MKPVQLRQQTSMSPYTEIKKKRQFLKKGMTTTQGDFMHNRNKSQMSQEIKNEKILSSFLRKTATNYRPNVKVKNNLMSMTHYSTLGLLQNKKNLVANHRKTNSLFIQGQMQGTYLPSTPGIPSPSGHSNFTH